MTFIPLSAPDVGDIENDSVARAMSSGWVAPLGPDVDAFELEIAARTGAAHGVALSSGTAALHLGLLAAGVGPGMVVPTSTLTFAATANAIAYTGAIPFFIDSEVETGNLDVDLLAETLAGLDASGQTIGAILPVDIYGKAADHTTISNLASMYGVPVIADSAESLGATHAGRAAGSFGLASAVSFNGNKIMTTSGGGMLLTDDEEVATTVKRLATQARQPVAHYEHTEIGYNYRLSNVLAALGRAQLTRLDAMIARRREIRSRYRAIVEASGCATILGGVDDRFDNCWLTSMVFQGYAPIGVTGAIAAFAADEIETRRLWKPMHLQPVFSDRPSLATGVAERLFETGLTLPSGSGMTDDEIDRVCDVLARILQVSNVPS
ncbi:pyridoxal-5'-phosphate-dependent protein [Frondihabitans sp. PAMC 28766]|uniref:DegT/DnrJ/EryC1/StrS family aminotransferase n=1 Tax=Frondihabitans sp. PAMC 28766 TaxID=1795630 RepID=UPI00078C1DA1|nr:DegT/DnrJ/EryC1/StrS family aminotransferase [Frondihabitans sp. PAMC 28766]AMM19178.1 pyridoxal-5'-phosphate-dependent protein [Frondihabitans sp. PAMC 28766]